MPNVDTQYWTARQAGELRKRKLLLVDEDLEDLRYYARIFDLQGFEVRTLSSYEEGAACLESEVFDLVIVGQNGPGLEGRPVVSRATRRDRKLPVLVLTRFIDWLGVLEAVRSGAHGCHLKSLGPSEIAQLAVKAVVSQKWEV